MDPVAKYKKLLKYREVDERPAQPCPKVDGVQRSPGSSGVGRILVSLRNQPGGGAKILLGQQRHGQVLSGEQLGEHGANSLHQPWGGEVDIAVQQYPPHPNRSG